MPAAKSPTPDKQKPAMLGVLLPYDLQVVLDSTAKQTGLSKSAVARMALSTGLSAILKKIRK